MPPSDTGPSNLDAEQALLGILMFDGATVFGRLDELSPDHFSEGLHARMFSMIVEVLSKDGLADPITMFSRLASDPDFDELGGMRYLADLVDKAPPSNNATEYAREIVDTFTRRQTIALAQAVARAAGDSSSPISQVLVEAEAGLSMLARGAALPDKSLITALDATTERLDEMADAIEKGRQRGALTGLRCFDRRMGGLQPGWLITIGGRPSMGKTALMRAAAFGCARHNPDAKVIIYSMEMPRGELIDRALSELSDQDEPGIPYFLLAQGKIGALDLRRLRELRDRIPPNIVIDDTPALSLDDIRRRTWAVRRKHPVSAFFVDFLQKMPLRHGSGRNDSALYGEITGGLHQLARQTDSCAVLLSQLSRQVESRDDKRPQLSDLRESGSIEQDSNAVFFPYRPAYYIERSEPAAGTPEHTKWEQELELVKRRLDVICAKTRQGPIGTDTQVYFAEYDKIIDEGARS